MKCVFLTLICLITTADYADAVSVQRIYADLENLIFVSDKGTANARDLYIEIGSRGGQRVPRPRTSVSQELFIYRNGTDLEIETSLTTIMWKGIPEWLTVNLNLKARDLEASLGYDPAHQVMIKELLITKPSLGQARFKDLKVECYPQNGEFTRFELILSQCFTKGKLSGGVFDIPKLKAFLAHDVLAQDEFISLRELGKSIQLILSDNRYSLDVLTFMMGINLRSNGTVYFDGASQVATIRIDAIRFGRINITKMAFAVLKDVLTTDGIRVEAPYLYIQL